MANCYVCGTDTNRDPTADYLDAPLCSKACEDRFWDVFLTLLAPEHIEKDAHGA